MNANSKELAVISDDLGLIKTLAKDSKVDIFIFRAKTLSVALAYEQFKSLDHLQCPMFFNHQDVMQVLECLHQSKVEGHFFGNNRGIHLQQNLIETTYLNGKTGMNGKTRGSTLEKVRYGTSLHSLPEIEALVRFVNRVESVPEYVLLSNVFETTCKIGKRALTHAEINEMVEKIRGDHGLKTVKILLLGGIDENNLNQLEMYDHNGVAVMSLAKQNERLATLGKRLNNRF